jgi:hypothetical protein
MDFKSLVEKEMETTRPIILSYPWEDKACYGMWLAQTYYMVAHSTRLVALAGACCPLERNDLHARFVDHAKEERGHEKVAIADIKSLGFSLEDFPKVYASQAMYQVQYYWIQHVNPASFFGYTYSLEMLAVKFGVQVFEKVLKAHGEKSVKFLKLHSEDDVDHMDTANKLISKLTPEEMKYAMDNLVLSAQLYRQMLIEGQKISSTTKFKKSA